MHVWIMWVQSIGNSCAHRFLGEPVHRVVAFWMFIVEACVQKGHFCHSTPKRSSFSYWFGRVYYIIWNEWWPTRAVYRIVIEWKGFYYIKVVSFFTLCLACAVCARCTGWYLCMLAIILECESNECGSNNVISASFSSIPLSNLSMYISVHVRYISLSFYIINVKMI